MAEERLIDEDKDRKYRIRKNADGEDELYIDESCEEEDEIPVFEMPVYYGDDEEAADLTPEQLAERERIKREEDEARKVRVDGLCTRAEQKLEEGDFEAALYAVTQAEDIQENDGRVYCLKLKICSRNFTDFTSLEDCAKAADGVKEYADAEQKAELKELASAFRQRAEEVKAATEGLKAEVERGKEERRDTFMTERSRALKTFILCAAPFAVLLILAIVFSTMMFADEKGTFIIATAVSGGLAFIALVCTVIAANKLWSAARRVKLNERDNATKVGREYLESKAEAELFDRITSSFDDDIS